MILGNENALYLLFLIPLVITPLYIWSFIKKRRTARKIADAKLIEKINDQVSIRQQVLKAALLTVSLVFIIIALTEPKTNPRPTHIKQKGRDVVILLDVSRSMLAEDLTPNRLERSKLAINDLIDQLNGGRLAIVVFAGSSTVKAPLTQDYGFLKMILDEISTQSTPRGGTMIGDAIRTACDEVFDKSGSKYKDIILITDGNDHDSFAVPAAQKAAAKGIRIIAIGLGDDKQGARIPVTSSRNTKEFLTYRGEQVWSKHNSKLLKKIALATDGGRYLPVKPNTAFDLGEIYDNLVETAEKKELKAMTLMEYDEKFQLFLAAAMILIICEVFVSERKK